MQDSQQAHPIAGVFTPRLIARLHREGFGGSLRLSTAGATRVIYFRRGEIASAASNAEVDRLPNILIGDGRLTEPQLEMARSRIRPGVSLGKTLIELGFLTPSELLQGARRQVRQILTACCALTEGTYQVNPGPLPPEITVLGLPARRLIFDALMEAGDRQTVVREMGSMESVYRPSAAFPEGLASLKLEPSTEQVALAVDGQRTLRDISSQTALDDLTVSKVVLSLEILGLAEADRPAAPAAPTSQGRRIPVESAAAGEGMPGPTALLAGPVNGPAASRPVEVPATPEESVSPTGPEEDADLPPPIPPGELPAFAAPPGETPEWRLDPETGEKTMPGPVEMTFDGPVGPATSRPFPAGRWGAIAAVTAVVLAAAVMAIFLRGRQPTGPETIAEPAGTTPEALEDPGPPPRHEPPPSVPGPPGPAVEPTPEAEPRPPAAVGTPPEKDRIAAAHRLIDEGQVAEAADAFRSLVRAGVPGRFTLQLMIACEPGTVQKALAATRFESGLIVVPYALQGRNCFRACWGVYGSKEEAAAAASSLPAYFTDAARRPVVISLARLASPS